ncbi:MAG: hypothetical protein WCX47_01900 [Bacilli bacterium]|jgi:hypothetical protein|nr:hypothetical protein [Bacilli bacterium]MDD3389549.1 hypothetical protein [Bacilli bacterium]MDD4345149.1 hypothetical protein [Bacilli bacterium]MDD4521003.1 hypothetical protein [Bacilli bacterium]MDY0399749.1 hypothetical protein [Bacilli bacterium]
MSIFNHPEDKKRPDNEPSYDSHNAIDRKITSIVFIVVAILLIVLAAVIIVINLLG